MCSNETPRKEVPIVVFTASTREPDMEKTLSLGAREYVQKPMDLQRYRDAVVGMV
jgi:CheY-like chemotaxis protein